MKPLLLLVLLITVACNDRAPLESDGDSGIPAAGSWSGEAGDYLITLDLMETRSTGYWGAFIRLTGMGTYTHQPTQESGTFEAEGLRHMDNSNPSRAVAIWMDWTDGTSGGRYLGRYQGTIVNTTTIEGAITSQAGLLTGRAATLRKRQPGT